MLTGVDKVDDHNEAIMLKSFSRVYRVIYRLKIHSIVTRME